MKILQDHYRRVAQKEEPKSQYSLENLMKDGKAYKAGKTEKDFDPEQIKMGLEVEREHTSNPLVAKKITLDHLTEFPRYYSALKEMEDKLKQQQGE